MLGAVQNIFSDLKHYINADLVNLFKDALDQQRIETYTFTEPSLALNDMVKYLMLLLRDCNLNKTCDMRKILWLYDW